jgi:hypothetical protein
MLVVDVAVHATDEELAKLSWLAGCWKSEAGEPGSIEQWMSPAGGTMLGMSRTIKQGRAIEFEFMQIRTMDDGSLVFIARPSGQTEATFRLLRLSETEVVFENTQHDFPQRIAYRYGGGRLRARIEGKRDGGIRAIEFPMTRVSCSAGLSRN